MNIERNFPVASLRPGDHFSFISADTDNGYYVCLRREGDTLWSRLIHPNSDASGHVWTDSIAANDEFCFLLRRMPEFRGKREYDKRVAARKLERERQPGILQWYRAEVSHHADDIRLWERLYSDALQAIADKDDQIVDLESQLDNAATAWDDGYAHGARQTLASMEVEIEATRRKLLS